MITKPDPQQNINLTYNIPAVIDSKKGQCNRPGVFQNGDGIEVISLCNRNDDPNDLHVQRPQQEPARASHEDLNNDNTTTTNTNTDTITTSTNNNKNTTNDSSNTNSNYSCNTYNYIYIYIYSICVYIYIYI